jgi:tetratricopeptide (TPR) repeat protein
VIIILGAIPAWRRGWHAHHISSARASLARKDFEGALQSLERAESARPGVAETAYLTAVAHRRAGHIEKILPHLAEAKARGWPESDLIRQQLLLHAQVGRFSEVETQLKQLFQTDLNDEAAIEVYEALAHGYWGNHQIKDALQCLDYWIKWRPRDAEPRLMRADTYSAFNDPVAAEKEYRAILAFDPENSTAHSLLGTLLLERSAVDEAAGEFRWCLDHGHKDNAVLEGTAECEYRSGRPDEAERWLEKIDLEDLELERRAKVVKLKADIARFRRDHKTAVELLVGVLEYWPHDGGVHESLGQSYAALGDYESANRHLQIARDITRRGEDYYNMQRATIRHPNNPELRAEIAAVLTEQGLGEEAATWWRSALRIDPNHQTSHEGLAAYYESKGETALAEGHRQAAETASRVTFRRAWSALQEGDIETARKLAPRLEKYPALAPHARLLKAAFLCREAKYDEAEAIVVKEMAAPAMRPLALIVGGELLVGQGKLLAAEGVLQEVLQSNPKSVDAHRWLSIIYYDLGAIDHADFHLRQLADLAPDDYRPCRLLGLINKDYEVYDEAVRQYRESLRRKPDQPPRQEVLLEMAECQLQSRDYVDALATLDNAEVSPDAIALRAECLFNMGEHDAAVQMAADVLAKSPDHLRALLVQGDAALINRESESAIEFFRRALDVDSFDYTARHKLAQALQNAGKEEEARKEMAQADELKELRTRFSKLHEDAFARPRDAGPRRELAEVARRLGREDLAKMWDEAAASIEKGETAPFAIQSKGPALGPDPPAGSN